MRDPPGASDASARSTTPAWRDINVGVVPHGGKREMVIRLVNRSDTPVSCAELRTSCKCLSVIANKTEIEPCDDALAVVHLDLGKQPGFVGSLAVEVTAAGANGSEAIRFNVLAEVVPEGELAFCAERTQ